MIEFEQDLHKGLSQTDAAEVRRCVRTLLRRPLLHTRSPDADLLPLLYKHRERLRRFFASYLGYRLTIERRFVRLHKTPGSIDARGVPHFTTRAYVYFALTLAVLVEAGRQILLSQLVADVRCAAADAKIAISDDLVEIRALVAALRHLVALGVLEEIEGNVSDLAHDSTSEALITIDTDLLAQIVPRSRRKDLPTADDEWNTAAMLVRRKLVENPVTLFSDLADPEAEYVRHNYQHEANALERYVGLTTEARAEGIAVIDLEGYLTDLPFPAYSTVSRIALLALNPLILASRPCAPSGCRKVSRTEICATCSHLVLRYPAVWSKSDTGNIGVLATKVIELLIDVGLARHLVAEDAVLLTPPVYRWQPEVVEKKTDSEAATVATTFSLFDEMEYD